MSRMTRNPREDREAWLVLGTIALVLLLQFLGPIIDRALCGGP